MKPIGRALRRLALLVAMASSLNAWADLTASVDRDRVAMGDMMKLTISATANESINAIDLRPLQRDFDIHSRSSSSSTNIVNGTRSSTRQVIMDISPKREGTLRIPSLRAGQDETNYLLVAVGPATTAAGDPLVSFEAELERGKVYVQGQVLLTLRIQQAINLDSRSITELQLDNAFVKQLEQKSFQRTIEGRPWLVHEIRYAIFPEQSGTLNIPAQTFTARESQPRRSLFDSNSGRKISRSSEALTLQVLPRPASFPGGTWLPARRLEIAETWSTPPEQLRVGESATRRITVTGEGLQGAQLPPTLFPATPGLKYYPDQPVINDGELASGLLSSREDSAALVPTRAGNWQIPEVRIPWWDTVAGKLRYAVLPARDVVVAASLDATAAPISLPDPLASAPAFDTSPIAVSAGSENSGIWKTIAILSNAGWLLTLILVLLWRRTPRPEVARIEGNLPEAATFKQLLAACATHNALQARRYLIAWTATLARGGNIHSMDQVQSFFADGELSSALVAMNDSLYSSQDIGWDGTQLSAMAKRIRKSRAARNTSTEPELQLYPQSAPLVSG